MDCMEVRTRLSDLEDGSLSKTSEKNIRRHLLGCVDCSATARSLEAVREGLRQLPPVTAPPELLEKIQKAISGETLPSGANAPKDHTGSRRFRFTDFHWKFSFGSAAAVLMFASILWYMSGSIPGNPTRPTELSATSSASATTETAALLPNPEPMPVATARDSAIEIHEIHIAAVPVNQAPVQTARASSRASSLETYEYTTSFQPADRTSHSKERSVATLPEGMSDPKPRVYALTDLPEVPVIRSSTRFARVQPYTTANTAEAKPAHQETQTTLESNKHVADAQATRLRPPVPYGREISMEVTPEEREEMANRIVMAAKRLGGTLEKIDRDVTEGTTSVQVFLPERTAQTFIDDLWRNIKLPPEGMPSRSVIPAGPEPGIIAYTVHLHAH